MSSQGNKYEYGELADKLILAYSKRRLFKAIGTTKRDRQQQFSKLDNKDKKFVLKLIDVANSNEKHMISSELDIALDSIDLAKIYEGVDKREYDRESKAKDPNLIYEDFIVLELLHYFKHDFFKWVNKPECSRCKQSSNNIVPTGNSGPPSVNPSEISIIENYKCTKCNIAVSFPRYNNPIKLLETKSGRCGEWVNCFIFILRALLGSQSQIRYVWNHEDHVWCEYYSLGLKRWIHLDPCEGVFDEPNLYCENWGKKMSWCFAFGETYIMDVSDKYITKPDKQINKLEYVSSLKNIKEFIDTLNDDKLVRYYSNMALTDSDENRNLMKLYQEVILIHNSEELNKENKIEVSRTQNTPTGRQTGDAEWTKSRGEDGNE